MAQRWQQQGVPHHHTGKAGSILASPGQAERIRSDDEGPRAPFLLSHPELSADVDLLWQRGLKLIPY